MSRHHSEDPGIAGLCLLVCALMLLVVLLGQLFGQFRIYAPIAMQWVNAHGDLLRQAVWGVA